MSTNTSDAIWYEVFGNHSLDITAVAVERVSEKCLWLKGTTSQRARRVNRVSTWANYFATREEAVAYVRQRLEDNAAKAQEYYRDCQKRLAAFFRLEPMTYELRKPLGDDVWLYSPADRSVYGLYIDGGAGSITNIIILGNQVLANLLSSLHEEDIDVAYAAEYGRLVPPDTPTVLEDINWTAIAAAMREAGSDET